MRLKSSDVVTSPTGDDQKLEPTLPQRQHKCFFVREASSQPIMHFTGDARSKRLVISVRMPYTRYVGTIYAKATRGSLTYISAFYSGLDTTAITGLCCVFIYLFLHVVLVFLFFLLFTLFFSSLFQVGVVFVNGGRTLGCAGRRLVTYNTPGALQRSPGCCQCLRPGSDRWT